MQKDIYKNYSEKIFPKLNEKSIIQANDINELITLLNFCFQKKNDFFVENFNRRVINDIYLSYNKLKTNILTSEVKELFIDIPKGNIKLIRFILINFINNFPTITNNQDNKSLCLYITEDGIKRNIKYLSQLLKN